MDVVAACRVFVRVAERGSFTLGAAAAGVPQSVASRRIAALEEHFGERLFDRSTRRAALTAYGRDMLAPAKRMVQLAESLEADAERARLRPFSLAVPGICAVRNLALLDAAAHDRGVVLDFRPAGPADRKELLRHHEVRAALDAVPPDDAEWTVPLGVAASAVRGTGPVRLERLRPSRTQNSFRRVRIQPEDDVPHIRDRMEQLGHRAALLPAQITTATSLTSAVSATLRSSDLLLCSPAQAEELGLHWRGLVGDPVARGYRLTAVSGEDAARLGGALHGDIARALDVPEDDVRVDPPDSRKAGERGGE
ncbi:LysR family transcriptional regulator [Streptomyces sp. ODS28]|uniref:LysR family transcriptional regulator n=1 Tax=Streptomyces sp. ODS28 TaxID=3136688 RepID=UPI0031E6FEB8